MIAGDMLPTSVVKGKGFCDLIAFLQGTDELYSEAAASLREILSLAEKVALTTDAWTALTTESYVTLTAHFFTDWVAQSVIL